jgi:hypothetical protein
MLDDFDKERAETRPKKGARRTFLPVHHAPLDRVDDDFHRLRITRLSHPPYSPDLAQCDFWRFANSETKLQGNTLTSAMELMPKVNETLMDIL